MIKYITHVLRKQNNSPIFRVKSALFDSIFCFFSVLSAEGKRKHSQVYFANAISIFSFSWRQLNSVSFWRQGNSPLTLSSIGYLFLSSAHGIYVKTNALVENKDCIIRRDLNWCWPRRKSLQVSRTYCMFIAIVLTKLASQWLFQDMVSSYISELRIQFAPVGNLRSL